ncbi:MAG: hypothetical protein QXE33_01595 [Candidatus Micrarchaeaceae archaeon]
MTCDNCGRSIPRNKAVVFEKTIKFNTDLRSENNVRFLTKRKVYYCISCAKHLGIFERKKREAMLFNKRS